MFFLCSHLVLCALVSGLVALKLKMNCWMQSLLQTCQDSSPENSSSKLDITLEDRLMTVIRWISKRGGDFARQRTLRVPWERQKPSHTWNSSNSFCQTCNWHSAGNGKSNYWRITSCQTQKDCKVLLSTCEILDVASWCKSTILCAAVYHPICSVDPHALGLKTSNISWLVTELGLLSVPFLLVVCFCKFGRYTSCVCC